MKVLVIGGGIFVGRHIVDEAVARGWEVTVLTRGVHPLPQFSGRITHVRADRRSGLSGIPGTWDAVIDTSGYRPDDVAAAARLMRGRAGSYAFISSASVYPIDGAAVTEDLELSLPSTPGAMDPRRANDYGPLKVACEHELRQTMGPRALILRPGLIVGPYDPTNRFGYWPQRLARGGDVLAPGSPSDPVQIIDARDHAAFLADCLTAGSNGTFNVACDPVPMGDLLQACAPPRSVARLHWVDTRLLRLNRVQPWTELPLWQGSHIGPIISNTLARSAGLTPRPLASTAADTLAWERSRSEVFPRTSQLSTTREREILARYV